MDENDKEKLVRSGKKLSAYFDRELSDRELSEADKMFRDLREQERGLSPDRGMALDASVESSELKDIEDWREIRTSLRGWHAQEMRYHDREQVGAKLWSAIEADLAQEQERKKRGIFSRLLRGLRWESAFQLSESIGFSGMRTRSLVGGLAVAAVALMLLPQLGQESAVQTPIRSAGMVDAIRVDSIRTSSLVSSQEMPRRETPRQEVAKLQAPSASLAVSDELRNGTAEEAKSDSRPASPDLVLGAGGTLRSNSSRVGSPSDVMLSMNSRGGIPELKAVAGVTRSSDSGRDLAEVRVGEPAIAQLVGDIRGLEILGVNHPGLDHPGSDYNDELSPWEQDSELASGARSGNSSAAQVAVGELGGRLGQPSLDEDSMDWEWVRSRGSVILIRSEERGEPSLVWVAANR